MPSHFYHAIVTGMDPNLIRCLGMQNRQHSAVGGGCQCLQSPQKKRVEWLSLSGLKEGRGGGRWEAVFAGQEVWDLGSQGRVGKCKTHASWEVVAGRQRQARPSACSRQCG